MSAILPAYLILGAVCGQIVADNEAQSFLEYIGLMLFGAIVGTPCLVVAVVVIGWQAITRRFASPQTPPHTEGER